MFLWEVPKKRYEHNIMVTGHFPLLTSVHINSEYCQSSEADSCSAGREAAFYKCRMNTCRVHKPSSLASILNNLNASPPAFTPYLFKTPFEKDIHVYS